MNYTNTIGAAIILACGSAASAAAVVDLQPNEVAGGLIGITNVAMPELVGVTESDTYHSFSILSGDEMTLYEGTLMSRVVRSNQTGMLHFNYMIMDPNAELLGQVSHIEISGFAGLQTRVEYRNELTAPGDEGPIDASRSANGDILNFDFGTILDTAEESRFFFAMVDSETYYEDGAIATVYLESGESVSFNVAGAVPTPGALGLLSAAGLVATRRRR